LAKILLDRLNFFHNLNLCSIQANGKEKIAIVLKDNAYGHGIIEISKLSQEFGLTHAIVETVEEAYKIEQYFSDIIILKISQNTTYLDKFHIAINDICQLEQLSKNTNIHIKIDTGMHRNGISPDELKACIYSSNDKSLNITGIFTHYRSSDCLSSEYFWQKSIFKQIKKQVINLCNQLNIKIPKFHSANSNALFRDNNFNEDICRIGLSAYGYLYQYNLTQKITLKPVLSLWANKLISKKIKKNQCIGYGGTFEAKEDIDVSTYDIGYGDGFMRIDSKKSYKIPNGSKILGRISMDSLTLNCTDDEVCIFDDIKELTNIHDTIYYEILTSLKPSITRKIV
jgi:alanine racemase